MPRAAAGMRRRAGSRSGTRSPTWPVSGSCSRCSASRRPSRPGRSSTTCPLLRQIGGVVLVILGLNLAGFLPIPRLERTWRPLDAGASTALATMTGTVRSAWRGPADLAGASRADRLGGRLVGSAAAGWRRSGSARSSPSAGRRASASILGGILGLAAPRAPRQGAVLLVGYTLGLGVPFLILGALYDRAPAILRPLVAHGRVVSMIGGLLVVAIGVAMLFDWLACCRAISSSTRDLGRPRGADRTPAGPTPVHQRARHGFIGPFGARQVIAGRGRWSWSSPSRWSASTAPARLDRGQPALLIPGRRRSSSDPSRGLQPRRPAPDFTATRPTVRRSP